ncbi:hypothetical protein [Nonomuraea harbinensis]|uniref:Exo-alpha-sialidase n=1 Tax=Nonomuraea harbinensis TaxID=1286938 RepID=A0ABW1BXL1_9ACTN|nr:hypothetical protein [Nonomuraea harbinensis]
MASGASDQHRQPPDDPRPGDATAPDSPPADEPASPGPGAPGDALAPGPGALDDVVAQGLGGAPSDPAGLEAFGRGEPVPPAESSAPGGAHAREPRIRHSPPGPTDDRARGLPLTSPWGMPPFAAPTPEDEPQELPKGRRPYSSPTAEPDTEPRRRRRTVDRPDKLVASGPPRPVPPPHDPPREPEPSPPGEGAGKDLGSPHDTTGTHPDAVAAGNNPPTEAEPAPETRTRRDARTAPYGIAHQPPAPDRGDDAPRGGEALGTRAPGSGEVTGTSAQAGEEVRTAPYGIAHQPGRGEETSGEPSRGVASGGAGNAGDGQDENADKDEPVRRVGRPPGGRPARPDLLVASGPERPGGRHQRGPAPAAMRRASPVRRGRSPAAPMAVALAVALLVAAGVLVWQWRADDEARLRLATGTGRSGDNLFTVPAAAQGTDQKLNDVAAVGRAVVVVGSDTTGPTPRPLFLYSADGEKWQLGRVTGASTPIVQRVAGGDGRWLATGGDGVRERGLWTSADGLNWQAVGGGEAFRDGDLIHDIARTGSGFVAVGEAALRDGGAGPAAWHSADGHAWERVETRGLEAGEIRAVVARGDTVVAMARPAQGDGSRVLRSADGGRTWQATGFQLPEAMPKAGSLAVASKRFVLVATRQRTITGDVRAYCSPTGAEWSQCGTIDGLPAASPGVERLVSYEDGVAAVSQAGIGSYAVLTSTDGRSWSGRAGIGELRGATLRGFAIAAGGTLYAGGDRAVSDVDNEPVLMAVPRRGEPVRVPLDQVRGLTRMARETSGLASHDGRYVAVGSAGGEAGVWTSQDWKDWRSIGLGGPRRQQLNDVAFGRRGWLAVGGTQAGLQETEPLLVSSGDGRAWKKVPLSGDLARPGDHPYLDVRTVAAGPDGYLLAGEDRGPAGTAAAVWFTPDLRSYTRSERLPQGGSGVRLHDVAATPDGYVAVGGAGAGGNESGIVWVSPDGLNWTARERLSPPDASSAGLRQVAVYQDRLVAMGTASTTSGASRAFSAVSEDDGVTWETSWLPAERAAGVYDLAAAGQGLVAVGWHGEQGEGDSAAWISQDGLSWSRLDLKEDRLAGPGAQWLAAVTISGEEVVALGRSTTYSDDHLILWTSTLTAGR